MDTKYILSIDPGLSSGVALIAYNDERVWLEGAWQFGGGVRGLIDWWRDHSDSRIGVPGLLIRRDEWIPMTDVTVITEKFTARNTQGYSYRTDALEPLRCEGALIALGLMPDYRTEEKRWRSPIVQYLVS